ncbi:hypothetical protein [Flavobacterium sp. MDT1-60]|uniref:hypothetical protein n=1 Tax=Flavobacterium sp. MDT1-60 TaxID=1979344 RepID=UPI0017836C09|nr:hypothetical protein [Flavobacterium sp. MDT1-60]QOG03489.1 hypothetical protein IHE43_04395 [Flavobacterium sp. MDT1-60]
MSCHNLYELQNKSHILNIQQIQCWLIKFENEFHNAINDCDCRKWKKWLNNTEKPFPCVCSVRMQDCIFIEAYYKLNNALDLYKQQQYLIGLVLQYQSLKNNKAELKAFTNNLNALELNLPFDSKIVISLNPEPYEKIILQLNENEFEGVIEFQELLSNIINHN